MRARERERVCVCVSENVRLCVREQEYCVYERKLRER